MKPPKSLSYIFCFIFLFCIVSNQLLLSQDALLLTEDEMLSGYELSKLWDNYWAVGVDSLHKVKEQIWFKENNYLIIAYCQFENELSALKGTDYRSKSLSAVFLWGSSDGILVGDLCYYSGNNDYSLIFVRGNLGIQIVGNCDDRKELTEIAKTILNKIEANLSDEVEAFESTLREKQFPESSYSIITNSLIQSKLKDYNLEETWDSKWLVNQDEVKMGIRKTWRNQDSAVVVIDLCQFDSEQFAKSAAEIRASYGPWVSTQDGGSYEYYSLDSVNNLPSRIRAIINHDSLMNGKTKSYSFAGSKGKIAVHVHFYNPKGINPDTVYSIVKVLADNIVNF